MPDKWFNLKKIISLIVFIAVFSLMGLATGKPLMIVAYAAFFMVVVVIAFLKLKNKQRHFEVNETTNPIVRKVIGVAFVLLAVALPALIITRTNLVNLPVLNAGVVAAIFGITLLFIAMMTIATHLINNKGSEKPMLIIGYALIIIASAIPGFIMAGIDRSTTGIGSVYYVALAVVILAWNGVGLALNKD